MGVGSIMVTFDFCSITFSARIRYELGQTPPFTYAVYLWKNNSWVFAGNVTHIYDNSEVTLNVLPVIQNSNDLNNTRMKIVTVTAKNYVITWAQMFASRDGPPYWSQTINVNGFINIQSQWSTTGASPWLNTNDGDTSAIWSYSTAGQAMEYFTFEGMNYGGDGFHVIKNDGDVLEDLEFLNVSIEQSCDVALRDVPLKSLGEVMDTGTYLIHTLILVFSMRLSNSDKTTLESIFASNTETTVYLEKWTFIGWLREPDIIYEYKKDKPWKVTLTFDIYTYSYVGSSVGTFSNQQLRLVGGTTLDYENIIDFSVSEETSVAIPNWVNQSPSIDTNVWNKKLKRITYAVRETEYRLYKLLQMLTAHTAITFYDYIHGPTNKTAWLSSVRAIWNPLKKLDYPSVSFIDTPWEVEFEVIVQN